MADQPRKDQTKDLPPNPVTKRDEEKVKGGVSSPGTSRPRPLEPVNE